MMTTLKNIFLMTLSIQSLSPITHAKADDLVVYNENETNYLWRVTKNPAGVDSIMLYSCPKNKPVTLENEKTICGDPAEISSLSNFKSLILNSVFSFSKKYPSQGLDPLKPENLKVLLENQDYSQTLTHLKELKTSLNDVEEMLKILPNSEEYKKTQASIKKEISEIEKTSSMIDPILSAINDYSDNIINLITTNKADQTLNYYARSQMKGTFLHEILSYIIYIRTTTCVKQLAAIKTNWNSTDIQYVCSARNTVKVDSSLDYTDCILSEAPSFENGEKLINACRKKL